MPYKSSIVWNLPKAMWATGPIRKDSHFGFRGSFKTDATKAEIRVFCPCPFLIYLDGEWIGEGPVRWAINAPEYQAFTVDLKPGSHVIAVFAHYEGVSTRMMETQPPFLACDGRVGDVLKLCRSLGEHRDSMSSHVGGQAHQSTVRVDRLGRYPPGAGKLARIGVR